MAEILLKVVLNTIAITPSKIKTSDLIISAIFVLIIVIFLNFRLNSGRTLEHILKMIKYYNVHGVHLLLNTSIIWSITSVIISVPNHSSVTSVITHALTSLCSIAI